MSDNFFEMVKNWTVNDYKTPGIKAEVILDMLISEFIEDLIGYYCGEKITLLAKEFPIRTNDDNFLNAKVDYLVSTGKKLILVELKTTKDSFKSEQLDRMKDAVKDGAEKLIGFYNDICELKKGNSLDSKKYRYSQEKFNEKAQLGEISEADYLYILLTDDTVNIEKNKKLVLENICNDDKFKDSISEDLKRELWAKVSVILSECANAF